MTARPDGKSATPDRVTFTRGAAERISKAVRTVEAGDRDQRPMSFGPRIGGGTSSSKTFRIGTFTGSWSKNQDKVVTFKYQTSTPNTVTATNLFANVTAASGTINCAIAKDGTAWFLIAAECS